MTSQQRVRKDVIRRRVNERRDFVRRELPIDRAIEERKSIQEPRKMINRPENRLLSLKHRLRGNAGKVLEMSRDHQIVHIELILPLKTFENRFFADSRFLSPFHAVEIRPVGYNPVRGTATPIDPSCPLTRVADTKLTPELDFGEGLS
jgi:hypothetical protein